MNTKNVTYILKPQAKQYQCVFQIQQISKSNMTETSTEKKYALETPWEDFCFRYSN